MQKKKKKNKQKNISLQTARFVKNNAFKIENRLRLRWENAGVGVGDRGRDWPLTNVVNSRDQ